MIRLTVALISLCASAWAEPSLEYTGAMRWELDAPWFGGWSGIEVQGQGTKMTVISDRGYVLEASLQRTNGRLLGVRVQNVKQLANPSGDPLPGKASDAEGLAIGPAGSTYVSFEHHHRIMQLDLATGRTRGRINLPFQDTMGENSGIEALAIGSDGTLYALVEAAPAQGQPILLYAHAHGQWRVSAHIPQHGPFLPVGADIDAKGRLWLLERTVTPLGFRSRVRMFVLDRHQAREYVLLTTIPAQYDNLEGISVWEDAGGQVHLTLISDDNFFRIQRNQIVEYLVRE